MVVAGFRFDTSMRDANAPGPATGPRWSRTLRRSDAFVARHPTRLLARRLTKLSSEGCLISGMLKLLPVLAIAAALPHGSEPVNLDPADFTTKIDNAYWPMRPGSRWVYRETDSAGARQRVVVTVTRRTKLIANGITARVVHDVVTEDGKPVEVTDDWYAQDKAGNIWYLGEDTTEYENGKPVSKHGSFEAGVDGAQPGVIMPARPRVGMRYRQEYYKGHAEDRARIFSIARAR